MASFNLDDLLNTQPSTVSRDLTGYITFVYGEPKIGKTTFARDMHSFILECEAGTNALTGAYGRKMQNWADIKTFVRLVKDPKFKEKFPSIAVDTVDLAASYCEKYVCNQLGIDSLGEAGYGKGWTAFKKEFEDVFHSLTMLGYAVLFISHSKIQTITRPDGSTYDRIVPTVSSSINKIVENMADIISYFYQDPKDHERYMLLRSLDGTVDAGSRFKYMEPRAKLGYEHMVDALNNAINKEAEMSGAGAVVETRTEIPPIEEFDYDAMMKEANDIIKSIPKEKMTDYAPRITQIVEKYLGKGHKLGNSTRDQVEQISLILADLKDLIK